MMVTCTLRSSRITFAIYFINFIETSLAQPDPSIIISQQQDHRRLTSRRDGYNFMFYFVIGAILLTCLVYNLFFKHKIEESFLRHTQIPETMFRQDVIVSDQEITRLWECDVCLFQSYDAQKTCMLCGTERSYRFVDRNVSQLMEEGDMTSAKYVLYDHNTPKSIEKGTTAAAASRNVQQDHDLLKTKLSTLNLRQQSARRRHEWIRHRNEDGQLVWKRQKHAMDRQVLKQLRYSPASSRESFCSNGSVGSVGVVSRFIVSPTNNTSGSGRVELDSPVGASASRCADNSTHFTTDELEQVGTLPFQQKQAWFVQHTAAMEIPWEYGHLLLEIERENVLHNSCEQLLWATTDQLHQSLRIKFTNEPGVDAGGLVREWFTLMSKEVFDDSTGLFYTTNNGDSLMINPASNAASVDHLMYYQAIGRFIGRALFEGILIDAHLALPLCKHLLGIPITFSDLEFLDVDLYKNLKWLRDHQGVEALALDFTVTVDQCTDKTRTIELIPNGAMIAVTDENKKEYVELRFRWIVATSISSQLASFAQGLFAVIPRELLSVFDHQELELLLCGIPDIDVIDWQLHTQYIGERDEQITRWFWYIVTAFTNEQRARLLQFTTGSTRVPVQGFKALTMNDGRICPFAIQCVHKEECLYPRAHTCFNRIDLPRYDTEKELQIALSLVIQLEVTGFTIE